MLFGGGGDLVDINGRPDPQGHGNGQCHRGNHERAHEQRNDAIPVLPETGCQPFPSENERRYRLIPRYGAAVVPRLEFPLDGGEAGHIDPGELLAAVEPRLKLGCGHGRGGRQRRLELLRKFPVVLPIGRQRRQQGLELAGKIHVLDRYAGRFSGLAFRQQLAAFLQLVLPHHELRLDAGGELGEVGHAAAEWFVGVPVLSGKVVIGRQCGVGCRQPEMPLLGEIIQLPLPQIGEVAGERRMVGFLRPDQVDKFQPRAAVDQEILPVLAEEIETFPEEEHRDQREHDDRDQGVAAKKRLDALVERQPEEAPPALACEQPAGGRRGRRRNGVRGLHRGAN